MARGKPRSHVRPVPDALREFAAERLRSLGPRDAATTLGIGRPTLMAVVAGYSVMPGTRALLEQAHAKSRAA